MTEEGQASASPGARQPQPEAPLAPHPFRWQAFFERASEPLFLLSRRRRLLFVNHAWEELTGLTATEARGLICRPHTTAEPGSLEEVLARALAPPSEVRQGKACAARRWIAGVRGRRAWWEVEFFPLGGPEGHLGVLGKIARVCPAATSALPPLPEKVLALREGMARRYRLDQLTSSLPVMHRVVEQVRLASQTRVPVLVVGEPGTGKRWVARTLHFQSVTRDRPFVALDCGRLPIAALTAALFGEGSAVWRTGSGTCYLHELFRLPRDLQVMLCQDLHEDRAPDGPRVIAGCSVDPAEAVQAGQLLEDLHCALTTLRIALPPLRQRPADLPALVEQILDQLNSDGANCLIGLTSAAWDLVRAYSWLGNLRELYTVLQGARFRARGEQIDALDLPANLRLAVHLERTSATAAERPLSLDHLLERAERRLIVLALRRASGNRSRAAELLSIWRPRLLRRLEALGITDEDCRLQM